MSEVTLKNTGTAPATLGEYDFLNTFEVDYDSPSFIKNDDSWNPTKNSLVSYLGVGATITVQGKMYLGRGNAVGKEHSFRLCTDVTKQVKETNESNNCGPAVTVTIVYKPGPDLVVSEEPKYISGSGNHVQFSGVVTNDGNKTARPAKGTIQTKFEVDYHSRSFVLAEDFRLGQDLFAVEPGQSIEPFVTWFNMKNGTHSVRFCADTNASITESDERNNCGPAYVITVPVPIIPPKVTVSVSSPKAGVTWVIGEKREIRWRTEGYAGATVEIGIKSPTSGGYSTILSNVPNTGLATWEVQATPRNDYTMVVYAGTYQKNAGSGGSGPFSIVDGIVPPKMGGPDLVVDLNGFGPIPNVGDQVKFDYKVWNKGGESAGNFRVRFYVLGNGPGYTYIGPEEFVGEQIKPESMWPGPLGQDCAALGTFCWTPREAGRYLVRIKADAGTGTLNCTDGVGGTVAEVSGTRGVNAEANNCSQEVEVNVGSTPPINSNTPRPEP